MHDAAVGHHCPDCVAEARRAQRGPRTAFGGTLAGQQRQVTKTLIGINVAVAVLAVIVGGTQAVGGGGWGGLLGGATQLHRSGAMWGYGVSYFGEWYRLFTSMFLHFGLFHLLLNMWALWVVGGVLEPLLGRARFLALYLISGLGGSVAVYLFDPSRLTAGASGAVFGLFAAFYILLRKLRRDTSLITGILVINLIITFLVDGISIAGHLGGMITGGLVALGLAYAPREQRTPIQIVALTAIVVVLAGLVLGLAPR